MIMFYNTMSCPNRKKKMSDTVVLTIPGWKYKKMIERLDLLKKGMRMVKINESIKSLMMDDIYAIEGMIKQNKKEPV